VKRDGSSSPQQKTIGRGLKGYPPGPLHWVKERRTKKEEKRVSGTIGGQVDRMSVDMDILDRENTSGRLKLFEKWKGRKPYKIQLGTRRECERDALSRGRC